MLKRGSLDWKIEDKSIEVDWEAEVSTDYSGSRDVDFEAWSYNKEGKSIPLKSSLQDEIYLSLSEDGEF